MGPSFRDAEHEGWLARAESYDALFTPITDQAIAPVLQEVGALSGKSILDVCCGPGHLAAAAVAAGARCVGIDFARSMVEQAARNHPAVEFREGDAEALRFDDGTFDAVACAFGIMHLARPERALDEALRVLKPGGKYVFTQWALDDELLKIVFAAIGEHGRLDVGLPSAPPPMRFSDPENCRNALGQCGFADIAVRRIELVWHAERGEALVDLIQSSAVRAALLLEAQEAGSRVRIRQAIVEAAEARRSGNRITIRRPAVLASGTKPS